MQNLSDIIEECIGSYVVPDVELSYLFGGMDTIPNPLAAVRALDDASQSSFASADERACALDELEGLSLRLWHMATTIGIGRLSKHLAEQPDGGKADLKLLGSYAEILGARNRPAPLGPNAQAPIPGLSNDLDELV